MKSCAICGSHAFNMALEGVNQGDFCDRHYWQRKAESLEAARAASPKVPQAKAEPTVRQLHMIDRGHRKGFCDVDDETGTLFSNVPAKWAQELIETFCDAARYRSLPQQVTALPQGVEEWIAEHGLQYVDTLGGYGAKLKRSSELKYPCPEYVSVDDLSELLSGMAIVPVEPTARMLDALYNFIPEKYATKAGETMAYKSMLAATKEKGE